jgi:hypothetical protein
MPERQDLYALHPKIVQMRKKASRMHFMQAMPFAGRKVARTFAND